MRSNILALGAATVISSSACHGQFGVPIGFDGNKPETDGYGSLIVPLKDPDRVHPEDLVADRWVVEDFKKEQKSILDELDANAPKLSEWEKGWTGVYRSTDEAASSSTTFTIGMAGRYAAITEFEDIRCRTEWSGLGTAEVGENRFVIESDEGVLPRCLYGTPTPLLSYTLFTWGDERLFIPDRRMVWFVNRYNSGREDWSAVRGLFRRVRPEVDPQGAGAAAGRPAGKPELPAPYAAMLLDRPVRLVVQEIQIKAYNHTVEGVLRCSGGSRDGVYEDMEIEYRDGEAKGTIRVVEVSEDSCLAKIEASVMPAVGHSFEFGPKPEGPRVERPEGEDGG
jgi:hypothetical protein